MSTAATIIGLLIAIPIGLFLMALFGMAICKTLDFVFSYLPGDGK